MKLKRGKKFRIVPKRDWGSVGGHWINGKRVNKGFVVTDGFCNVMPGATWFQTVEMAFRAIEIWSTAKDGSHFWRLVEDEKEYFEFS